MVCIYGCIDVHLALQNLNTEMKMSFWRNFHQWLPWKLSFWQLSVQSLTKISSKWWHFRFRCSVYLWICGKHDDVIKWKLFRVTGPLCGKSPVPGEVSAQRPVTRSFDVFSVLRLNKRLSKQSWGWWFETQRVHYDVTVMVWEPHQQPVQEAIGLTLMVS